MTNTNNNAEIDVQALPEENTAFATDTPRDTKVISILNQKGGVAKTTTVKALSSLLWQDGNRVLVIDMDPSGQFSQSMGYDPLSLRANNVASLLAEDATPNEKTIEAAVSSLLDDNWHLIPASTRLNDMVLGKKKSEQKKQASRLKRVIDKLRGKYDYVLIDTPPEASFAEANASVAADWLLVPTCMDLMSIKQVDRTLDYCNYICPICDAHPVVLGVLPCMYRPNIREQKKQLDGMYLQGYHVFSPITTTTAVQKGEDRCIPFTFLSDTSSRRVTAQYRRLLDEIKEQLQVNEKAAVHGK